MIHGHVADNAGAADTNVDDDAGADANTGNAALGC